VTARFISISSYLLLFGMLPLAISLSLDLYLVGRMMAGRLVAILLATAAFAFFAFLWFAFPRINARRARRAG
jgi:hypothetical protein